MKEALLPETIIENNEFNFSKRQMESLAKHLLIWTLLMIVLFPIIYIISISFNPSGSIGSKLIPEGLTLDHWKYILGIPYIDTATGKEVISPFPILLWLWNSIKISSVSALMMLLLSTTSAYALSRFRFKGRQVSLLVLMIIQMFPNIMAMVAFYFMLDFLGQFLPWLGTDSMVVDTCLSGRNPF